VAINIDKRAIVSPDAIIEEDVTIGPYSIINDKVHIKEGTVIGAYVFIDNGTTIGKNCKIYHHTSIGTSPQDLKYNGEETFLEIGDNTVIREFVDINRGTTESFTTRIGSNVLLMAYTHIAHDCQIGDRVILANAVNLGGHVVIGDDVVVGGMVPVHQFTHIGNYSIIGGGWRVPVDVPPFVTAAGDPLSYKGLNVIGLKRKGFDFKRMNIIKRVYRMIYDSNLSREKMIEELEMSFPNNKDVQLIVEFLKNSTRSLLKGFSRKSK